MHLVDSHQRWAVAAMLVAVLVTVSLVGRGVAAPARSVATQRVTEHIDLKLVKKSGASKFDHSGRAAGTFSGSVRSKITLSHSVLMRGTVTIATKRGKVRLKVDGRARSLELRTKFNGSATIVGGTGSYARATGKGTFKGVVNRSTWHATLDATGSFTS